MKPADVLRMQLSSVLQLLRIEERSRLSGRHLSSMAQDALRRLDGGDPDLQTTLDVFDQGKIRQVSVNRIRLSDGREVVSRREELRVMKETVDTFVESLKNLSPEILAALEDASHG